MQALSRILNEAPDQDPNRFVPGGRPQVPGVAPSVAQSAQLYLMNIAQSIAPYCNWSLNGLTPRTGMDGTSTRLTLVLWVCLGRRFSPLLRFSWSDFVKPQRGSASYMASQRFRPASTSLTERALAKRKEFATSANI
eukprot:s1978_g2.t1